MVTLSKSAEGASTMINLAFCVTILTDVLDPVTTFLMSWGPRSGWSPSSSLRFRSSLPPFLSLLHASDACDTEPLVEATERDRPFLSPSLFEFFLFRDLSSLFALSLLLPPSSCAAAADPLGPLLVLVPPLTPLPLVLSELEELGLLSDWTRLLVRTDWLTIVRGLSIMIGLGSV